MQGAGDQGLRTFVRRWDVNRLLSKLDEAFWQTVLEVEHCSTLQKKPEATEESYHACRGGASHGFDPGKRQDLLLQEDSSNPGFWKNTHVHDFEIVSTFMSLVCRVAFILIFIGRHPNSGVPKSVLQAKMIVSALSGNDGFPNIFPLFQKAMTAAAASLMKSPAWGKEFKALLKVYLRKVFILLVLSWILFIPTNEGAKLILNWLNIRRNSSL